MTKRKKLESNRENAQKSSGPRTKIGKEIVSQNARTHGLLSRNLIVEGESHEEFSAMLNLLRQEFQPVGMVENALVERIAISFWRQRRLVDAESANVSLNRQSFGSEQALQIVNALNLSFNKYSNLKAPEEDPEEIDIETLHYERKLWSSLLNRDVAHEKNPFAHIPKEMKEELLEIWGIDTSHVDEYVINAFSSWEEMFAFFLKQAVDDIEKYRIRELSRLVMNSQTIPSRAELLTRYQTALDNDLYKALKALREAQSWRESKNIITATPVSQSDDGNG